MAGTVNKFTRRIKTFYELLYNEMSGGKIGIDKFLFRIDDVDTSSDFALDRLIQNPHGVQFRHRGEQAAIREYAAGTGTVYDVPRASEKTPITEQLRDSVIVGGEETEGFGSKEARMISQILRQHTIGHTVTRWKLALDTIRTGIFAPLGLVGNDIGLSIDFQRDAGLSLTYDFTAVGADINKALFNLYKAYRDAGGGAENICLILGDSWLSELEQDETVIEYMKTNVANITLTRDLVPPELMNTQGLYLVARYRIPGTVTPVYICGFSPDNQFIPYSGGVATDFFPEGSAIIFSTAATRYRVMRGVDVLDDSCRATRAVGEIVFDTYTEKDPVATYLRSSARYAFVPGEIDHTAVSVGTFPVES